MIKYAITGNIASGKSTVEDYIKSCGYKVLDSDKVGHSLLEIDEIKTSFKDEDIFDGEKVSRKKLANLVFSNNKYLKILEQILHPKIREKIIDFFNKNSNEPMVFVSVPLLFEARMENLFDKIIFIYTDDNIREQRLIKRNGYTKQYAQIRMNAQLSQKDKIKKSDIIIYNNTTKEDLINEIQTKLAL